MSPAEPLAVPEDLPFLESLSWSDTRWRELSPLEMLQRGRLDLGHSQRSSQGVTVRPFPRTNVR
jgi:hypothetical protein